MAELDLQNKYKNFIINTISVQLPEVEIFIYGSRIQGKAQKYSDVDIAIKSGSEIPIDKLLQIKAAFHDSSFPYKVDIVDLNALNKDFYKLIENDLYKIN